MLDPADPDVVRAIEAADFFMERMIAAALGNQEEAVRLAIVQAFRHDHDIHDTVVPARAAPGSENWAVWSFHCSEDQERIYL